MESQSRPLTTTIRSAPSLDDYIPLAEHQSRTPETFFGGKPILYYHAAGATAYIPKSQRGRLPFFPADSAQETVTAASDAPGEAEEEEEEEEEVVEQKVDLFVNSETLIVFSQETQSGVSIPYPVIGIHAIKTLSSTSPPAQSVYLQLNLDDDEEDAADDTVELTVVPAVRAADEAAKLFSAISQCADLHPDAPADSDSDAPYADRIVFEPHDDDDGRGGPEALDGFTGVYRGSADGALPPPLPGSGGWITAENLHEYFDAEGNWIGGDEEDDGDGEGEGGVSGELGEGAGRVRGRDEVNGHEGGADGDEDGDAESKRVRTE